LAVKPPGDSLTLPQDRTDAILNAERAYRIAILPSSADGLVRRGDEVRATRPLPAGR
jgi:hypothetical protein